MYHAVLLSHSLLRWLVVALGAWAVASAWQSRRAPGGRGTVLPGLAFTAALDIQMLAGLVLYTALSPITTSALLDVATAMRNSSWRFWVVEHPAAMLLAVVFAHVGRPRRDAAPAGRRALVWYGLALAALLAATPWPFMAQGRPWIRW